MSRPFRKVFFRAVGLLIAVEIAIPLYAAAHYLDPTFRNTLVIFTSLFVYITTWAQTGHSPLYWLAKAALYLESWQQAWALTMKEGVEVLMERRPGLERKLREEIGQS